MNAAASQDGALVERHGRDGSPFASLERRLCAPTWLPRLESLGYGMPQPGC